ncbi:hypothetical protein [Embleya scabrispora]|uniref:hypothetical protein n=1 Tax=Embleya scabrispora TaxID=159449 RepID=UPI0003A81CF9|nr:hypothetical protein [Embleya scabrispora]MYS82486.1 hypothetical protein [Streptomyces sp. SID5474]
MRRIVIRVGTAAIAGTLLLAATACGRDEEALARQYASAPPAAPEASTAVSPVPPGSAPAGSAPPAAVPPAAASSPGEPPPALPPTDESPAPSTNRDTTGNGSDPAAQARLDAALLTAAEMPAGAYEVNPDGTETRETVRDAGCRPLIDLTRPGQAASAPAASAQASVTRGDPTPTGFTIVELFSFAGTGAQDLFAKGRAALPNCTSVTSTDTDGVTSADTYAAIPHASLGDESLAIGMTPQAGGALGLIVVRVGPTIVVVSNADLSATTPGLPADDLVARQITKLLANSRQ